MARVDHARAAFTVRCAIYTRKSSDEGIEQEFNSRDAQREACEAYIVSQRHAGWVMLPDMYDDGGLSGGTMERPALKRLLEDIKTARFKSSLSTRSHGAWIATSSGGRLRLQIHSTWRRPMPLDHHSEEPTAIRTNLGAIFVSLELSRSTWLITSLSPGGGEKMSKHSVSARDIAGLLSRFSELKQKAFARMGQSFPIIVIQEAGLDGFLVHGVHQREVIESYVVDAASIATSRRRRRAKTDRIDGEALVCALLAYKRGEPRVCAMIRAPTPEDEDRRRLCRERKTLTVERVQHVNRIKGLLFSQGVSGYEPLRRNRRQRLGELKTGDGRPLPPHLKSQIGRELDRLELLLGQIKAVEAERDALLTPATETEGMPAPQAMLIDLRG